MKIEKINDKQIRCTISKSDLAERKIKLSELACGTGNSRELFRDMIRQASDDFGFEVDDIPLMIEAIPVSSECIILILTKVDNPAETESHFSKLLGDMDAHIMEKFEASHGNLFEELDEFDDIEDIEESTTSKKGDIEQDEPEIPDTQLLFSIYSFDNLSRVLSISKLLHPVYEGDSALYKSPLNNRYYLSLCTDADHKEHLKFVTSVLSEYGTHEYAVYNSEFFYMEHFDCIVDKDAIEKLAGL